MGKQGVNAHLVFRREEHKLGFAALQPDRVITLDFHHTKLSAPLRYPIPNGEIITNVQKQQQ